jgi:hypothetical protein
VPPSYSRSWGWFGVSAGSRRRRRCGQARGAGPLRDHHRAAVEGAGWPARLGGRTVARPTGVDGWSVRLTSGHRCPLRTHGPCHPAGRARWCPEALARCASGCRAHGTPRRAPSPVSAAPGESRQSSRCRYSRSRAKCSARSSARVFPIMSPLWGHRHKGDHGNSWLMALPSGSCRRQRNRARMRGT